MNADVAARLIAINREFYTRFGEAFSATRHRIQPGVRIVIERLQGDESILDLGCGNGELARELAKRGHRGPYLGVDFSLPLLRDAATQPRDFSAKFRQADLTKIAAIREELSLEKGWSLITAFSVFHHIPSHELQLAILETVRTLLASDGKFILSNWQFLNSKKLKARIQPWEKTGIQESDVDAGDYLLDWHSGGEGLRYIHHFGQAELALLAERTGFVIRETFTSDGETGNLGLYQVWESATR